MRRIISLRIPAIPVLLLFAVATIYSAGNGKIAFVSNRDGNLEIYLMNSDGTEHVRLTNTAGPECQPTFSPNGRKIAFVGLDSGASVVKVMNADGTDVRVVTPIISACGPNPWHDAESLSWSPDGTRLAFQELGDIYVTDLEGKDRRNITNSPDATDMEPAWAPDGGRILFTQTVPYWGLASIRPDGTDFRTLLRPAYIYDWDMSPTWSPSGDRIAFVRHYDFALLPALLVANADGSTQTVLDECRTGVCSTHRNNPRWSPDASKIVFNMWEFFSNDSEIYVEDLNSGGPIRELTNTIGSNFQPSWQAIIPMVTVSGRVLTADGAPIRNATVTITDPAGAPRTTITSTFGTYSFEDVAAGPSYTLRASAKRFRFPPVTVAVSDSLSGVDIVANPFEP